MLKPLFEGMDWKRVAIKMVLAVLIFNCAFAVWLDPPTDAEKENWKAALKNYTENESSGKGVASNDNEDLDVSGYLSKRQTLTVDQQNTVFKDAFATDPMSWTEVYGYVLNQIEQSTYFEEYGYVWVNNQSYWMTGIQYDGSGIFA